MVQSFALVRIHSTDLFVPSPVSCSVKHFATMDTGRTLLLEMYRVHVKLVDGLALTTREGFPAELALPLTPRSSCS